MATFRVDGMTCDHCARAVAREIGAEAPGSRVEVDLAGARVTVSGPVDEGAVRRAVERAGYAFAGRAAG